MRKAPSMDEESPTKPLEDFYGPRLFGEKHKLSSIEPPKNTAVMESLRFHVSRNPMNAICVSCTDGNDAVVTIRTEAANDVGVLLLMREVLMRTINVQLAPFFQVEQLSNEPKK